MDALQALDSSFQVGRNGSEDLSVGGFGVWPLGCGAGGMGGEGYGGLAGGGKGGGAPGCEG